MNSYKDHLKSAAKVLPEVLEVLLVKRSLGLELGG